MSKDKTPKPEKAATKAEGEAAERLLPQLDKLKTDNPHLQGAVDNALAKGEAVEGIMAKKAAELSKLEAQESVFKAISGAKDVESIEEVVKGLEGDAAEFAKTLDLKGLKEVPKYESELKAVELAKGTTTAKYTEKLHQAVGEFNASIKGLHIEGVEALKLEEVTKAVSETVAKTASTASKTAAELIQAERGLAAKFVLKNAEKAPFATIKEARAAEGGLLKHAAKGRLAVTGAAVLLGASLLMNRGKNEYKEFDAAAQAR